MGVKIAKCPKKGNALRSPGNEDVRYAISKQSEGAYVCMYGRTDGRTSISGVLVSTVVENKKCGGEYLEVMCPDVICEKREIHIRKISFNNCR